LDIDKQGDRDFYTPADEKVRAWDMQTLAKQYLEKHDAKSEKPIRTQEVEFWKTVLVYEDTEDQEYGLMSK
jgi:hypothetical protein